MKEVEIWKDIPDYEGLYQVSNFGRVKSFKRKGRILKPGKDNDGYLVVSLYKNGKRKEYRTHRLVCLTFLKNTENLPCINHKDENKENNHVSNLEWCTHKYNNNYGSRLEKASEAMKGKPHYKHRKPILQFSKEGEFIREWDSAKSASIELKIYASSITACCKGRKYKSVGGFIWKYKE